MGLAKRLGLKAGQDILERGGEVLESAEDRQARLAFEYSHPFQINDKVLMVNPSPEAYRGLVGTITRIQTSRHTGPCISGLFGGVNRNFHKPNEELILATSIAKLLFS